MPSLKSVILIFFLSTILFFNFCNSKTNTSVSQKPLELTAMLGGTGNFLDSIKVIYVGTTLYNPTNDTVKFLSMTCSYEDFFTTSSDSFKVQPRYDCFGNVPAVIRIPPKSKIDQFIMITRKRGGNYFDTSKLKIGMHLTIPKSTDGYEEIIGQTENKQNAEILWSNELELKRLYRRIYQ